VKIGNKKFLPIVVAALLAVALVFPAGVVAAPEALATRTLPASVDPGADFGVGIEASGCGSFGQVMETLPTSFSYVGTDSTDVNVTQDGNTVSFTFMADAVSFTYTVTASATAGTYSFSGVVKDEDKIEYTIGGDTEIGVTVAHPEVERESSGLTKAAFATSNLSISPSEVNIGEEVTISVLVTNTGNAAGSYEVTLKIDGAVEATKEVTLNAGANKEVTFTTAKDVAGSYSVTVNGHSGSFSIRQKPAPPPPPPEEVPPPVKAINWPVLGGIIAGVIVVGVLIFLLARRRAY